MNEQALLLVDVLEEQRGQLKVRSFLDDGSPFELVVNKHEVVRIPPSDDPKIHPDRGWMNVEFSGENHQRANITLPAPAIQLGHKVTVSTSRIKKPELPKKKVSTRELYKIVEYPGEINAETEAAKQAVREEAETASAVESQTEE